MSTHQFVLLAVSKMGVLPPILKILGRVVATQNQTVTRQKSEMGDSNQITCVTTQPNSKHQSSFIRVRSKADLRTSSYKLKPPFLMG